LLEFPTEIKMRKTLVTILCSALIAASPKRPLQRNIIMPARQAANRSWSITSSAIPTMNNPAILMSAARAVFFLAHANEKQGQANGNSNRCASACSVTPNRRRRLVDPFVRC
jgi:hypothetical protein